MEILPPPGVEQREMKEPIPKMKLRQRDECIPCPYNAGSTYQDPPDTTDPQCFQKTEEAFLGSLLAGEEDVTDDVCQYLKNNDQGGDLFWALYHLDIAYCGLAYVNQPGLDRKSDTTSIP